MSDDAAAGIYLGGLEGEVMTGWRRRSRNNLYKVDPEAWLWDILGLRWHDKQREIVDAFLHNRRVATKSANGTGKTRLYGELATWGVAVHEPGELLIMMSGPTEEQIKQGLFGYIDKNMLLAQRRGFPLPGYLTDSNRWNYHVVGSTKAKTLVLGRTPPRTNIVGTFQGIRAVSEDDVKTWVFIDEGGAVHNDLYDAAEAVTTGAGDNKIAVIGNPDSIGTRFQDLFEDSRYAKDWVTTTISAYDLPTFTGEIVYDDPEMQAQMLGSGMIDRKWVETAERQWGKESARFQSKVLGEFPSVADWCFFTQNDINTASNTQIEVDDDDPTVDRILGVDYADGGEDESKTYLNVGGRIRHDMTWVDANLNDNMPHERALATDANIVVMDGIGVGAGPSRKILNRTDRHYTAIRAKASNSSPDPEQWHNARAYWYDMLRQGMREGLVDLDFTAVGKEGEEVGKRLKSQLFSIVYGFDNRGAIQIESKKDMRKRGVKSPDDLDAVVFTYGLKARTLLDDPLGDKEPGDVVVDDPWSDLEGDLVTGLGMPI